MDENREVTQPSELAVKASELRTDLAMNYRRLYPEVCANYKRRAILCKIKASFKLEDSQQCDEDDWSQCGISEEGLAALETDVTPVKLDWKKLRKHVENLKIANDLIRKNTQNKNVYNIG